MRYVLRVCLPDRPGALGELATVLGRAGLDIVALDVIDREDGVAIDDIAVDGAVGADRLRSVCEQVGGVVVEAVAPARLVPDGATPTALAAAISETPADSLTRLVEGLPATLAATWAVAVGDGPAGLSVLTASATAPAVPGGLRLPFLPQEGARRLPQARWMPAAWLSPTGIEIAAARLHGPTTTVLLARDGGPRFREAELRRLEDLVRVAVAAQRVPPMAEVSTAH